MMSYLAHIAQSKDHPSYRNLTMTRHQTIHSHKQLGMHVLQLLGGSLKSKVKWLRTWTARWRNKSWGCALGKMILIGSTASSKRKKWWNTRNGFRHYTGRNWRTRSEKWIKDVSMNLMRWSRKTGQWRRKLINWSCRDSDWFNLLIMSNKWMIKFN